MQTNLQIAMETFKNNMAFARNCTFRHSKFFSFVLHNTPFHYLSGLLLGRLYFQS